MHYRYLHAHAPKPEPESEPVSERERGIQELLRRLHTREFEEKDIREAAIVVSQVQTQADSLVMSQRFLGSPLPQVRAFAAYLVKAVKSPESMDEGEEKEKEAEGGSRVLGYEAMAEVIRQWIREEKG